MVATQTEDTMVSNVQPLPEATRVDSVGHHNHHQQQIQEQQCSLSSLSSPSTSQTPTPEGRWTKESQEGETNGQDWEEEENEGQKEGMGKDMKGSHICITPDPPPLPPPPMATDGGYAWVVVVAVFCVNTLVAGYVKSFGLLYVLVVERFPDASGANGGWIMGLLVGSRGLLSPVMTALTVLVGARRCVIVGSLLTVAGLLAAIPAFNIFYMAITLGGIVGVGLCLSETPGFILVTSYFLEKRALANGIRAAGNPMGGIIFSPLVVFLHQQFGLQGAFLLMAGIMLQLMVLGSLMRPFDQHEKMIKEKHRRHIHNEFGISLTNDYFHIKRELTVKTKRKPIDFSFLINPAYLVYIMMVVCINLALPTALLYTPVHAKLAGLSVYNISILMAYISGSDFLLRLLCGWFANKNLIKNTTIFKWGFILGGTGCMLIPQCKELWQIMGATTLLSCCMATFWVLIITILTEQFGSNALPSTYGFFRMTQGVASFFTPTIIGLLYDLTGSMMIPFMVMGGGLYMGAIIFSLQPVIARVSGANITLE